MRNKRTKLNSAIVTGLIFSLMVEFSCGIEQSNSPSPGVPASPAPLSQKTPTALRELPSFGKIEWTLNKIPFVAKGPNGGISGMGMVVHDGLIYLMGGFIPAGDETDDLASRRTSRWTHRYDPKSKKWTRLPDMPGRREYTRAIATNNAIYVVGGSMQRKGSPEGELVADDCFKLDFSKDPPAWQKHSKFSVPRTHMAVGYIEEYLMVIGGCKWDNISGYHSSTMKGITEVFDLTKPELGWQMRSAIPGTPRGWTASAPCKNRLYMFGGLTFSAKKQQVKVRESLCYDPALDRWAHLAPPPEAISGWEAATYADRYIIVVGGCAEAAPFSDLAFAYDTETDRWMKINGVMPGSDSGGNAFNDPGVCIIDDTIYVAGAEGYASHWEYFLIGKIKPDLAKTRVKSQAQAGALEDRVP